MLVSFQTNILKAFCELLQNVFQKKLWKATESLFLLYDFFQCLHI